MLCSQRTIVNKTWNILTRRINRLPMLSAAVEVIKGFSSVLNVILLVAFVKKTVRSSAVSTQYSVPPARGMSERYTHASNERR
jgi:hypothetical protein